VRSQFRVEDGRYAGGSMARNIDRYATFVTVREGGEDSLS
jgi:hypothetical protein